MNASHSLQASLLIIYTATGICVLMKIIEDHFFLSLKHHVLNDLKYRVKVNKHITRNTIQIDNIMSTIIAKLE